MNNKDVRAPTISIITPSLNQSDFIELTIKSVLSQGYKNLEFIVMDGGSTDQTIDILKKYEQHLTWFSEPDEGQTHAINKGLLKASGDIVAYLNSDDIYLPGTIHKVAEAFMQNPEIVCVAGRCGMINESGASIRDFVTMYKDFWMRIGSKSVLFVLNYISQPAVFWRRYVIDEIGLLDEKLEYSMDYEYWLRISDKYPIFNLQEVLADFRLHERSKSTLFFISQFEEELEVAKRYASGLTIGLHWLHKNLIVFVYRIMALLKGKSK